MVIVYRQDGKGSPVLGIYSRGSRAREAGRRQAYRHPDWHINVGSGPTVKPKPDVLDKSMQVWAEKGKFMYLETNPVSKREQAELTGKGIVA